MTLDVYVGDHDMSRRDDHDETRGADFPSRTDQSGRVSAASEAERRAYEESGLAVVNHRIEVPALGTHVRVAEVGTGPPVVLIQGGLGHGDLWIPLLPELRGYTAYVMDRPGSGLSGGIDHRSTSLREIAASSTGAVFDHFGLDTAPIVGNSMGGLWSLRFALDRPERVSALVLLGCPALYPGTSAPFPMRLISVPWVGELLYGTLMRPDDPEGVRETIRFLGHPDETAANVSEAAVESWCRMETLPDAKRSWVSLLRQALRLRGAVPDAAFTPADLRSVQAPVRLIWGREDPFGSVEQGRRGADYFPEATFHEVGVGHLPWLDEPEACGELIRSFLDQHT